MAKESNGSGGANGNGTRSLERLIMGLPVVKRELADRRSALNSERKRIADRRAVATARRNGPEVVKLSTAFEAAQAAEQKAQAALTAARDRVRHAHYAMSAHTMECDLEITRAEVELRATCDPRIGELLEKLHDEFSYQLQAHRGDREENEARLNAIRAALDAADALQFDVEADAGAEVARIAATIPPRLASISGAHAAAPFDLRDTDERRLEQELRHLSIS